MMLQGAESLRKIACAALRQLDDMPDLLDQPVIDEADRDRMCAVLLTSYARMSQGLGR